MAWLPSEAGSVDIESLPAYFLDEEAEPPPTRPASEGFRVLAPPASAWATSTPAPSAGQPPWPESYRPPARPWPDCSVRRLVGIDFPRAIGALIDLYVGLLAAPAARRGTTAVVRGGAGWLEFTTDPARSTDDEHRVPAGLHVHRCGRPVPVEVVLAPWSRERTELRLQLRSRRGRLSIPRRYFDVAHPVMDALREAMEGRLVAS